MQQTTQSSAVAPKKRRSMGKKTKYGTACLVCKEDHKACDGGRPCSRCVSLGIASSCQSITRRKNKEESPVSGGFVFCLEEIAASKSRSPPASQPVCNTPPQQQQAPTSSPTYSANTYNFHYTSPSNNFSYTHSAFNQSGQPTQTPPTPSNRPPKRTKTASEAYQQVGVPRPAASPSPVDDLLLLEFSRPSGVALPTVPSVMQSLDSPAMEFEELEKDEALERLSQQQIELLQQQLLIEKERQAKLQKKLEIRRAQLQRPPQQLMPLQQQQYIYLDQLPQQESSTQVMAPEDFKQEFQLLQPLGQSQPTSSSVSGKKRKAAEIADANAFRYLLKDDEEISGSSSSGSEEDFDVSPDSDLDAEWFSDFFPVPLDVALDRKRFAPCWYAPFIIKDCNKPWSVLKPHVLEDGTRTAACVAVNDATLRLHALNE